MTLTEAILSIYPAARFGSATQGGNFVVGQSLKEDGTIGPEAVLWWDDDALGKRDDAAIAAAVAKPSPSVIRTATVYQLLSSFNDSQRSAYLNVKQWDQILLSARDLPIPEDNPKIVRIAAILNTTPEAWFDAALGV